MLDNLKEKIAFLENVKKNVVENNVFEIQKRLGILGEAKDLKKETYHSGLFRGLFFILSKRILLK